MLAATISSILGTLKLIVIGHRFLRMDHHQRELRCAAAKAFMESLDQLAGCLDSDDLAISTSPAEASPTAPSVGVTKAVTNLQALEAAAADIEAFIQAQHPKSHPTSHPT